MSCSSFILPSIFLTSRLFSLCLEFSSNFVYLTFLLRFLLSSSSFLISSWFFLTSSLSACLSPPWFRDFPISCFIFWFWSYRYSSCCSRVAILVRLLSSLNYLSTLFRLIPSSKYEFLVLHSRQDWRRDISFYRFLSLVRRISILV